MRLLEERLPTLPNMAFIPLLRVLCIRIPRRTRTTSTPGGTLTLRADISRPLSSRTVAAGAGAAVTCRGLSGFSLDSAHQGVHICALRHFLRLHLRLLVPPLLLLLFSPPRARRWCNGGFPIRGLLGG